MLSNGCAHAEGTPVSSSSEIGIRRASEADLGSIQGLYAEVGLDGGTPLPRAEAADIFRRMSRYPSYRLWVAETGGSIVGTYALLILDNIAHSGRPFAVVEQVAVTTRRQNAGIGRQMMHHAMDEARAAGCYKLILTSHVGRLDAHAFYDKLGFERHGYGFIVDFDTAGRK